MFVGLSKAKRLFDFITSLTALFLLLPILLLLLVLLVRVKLGSPAFFTQTRPGLHGHPFQLIKLRTMTNARSRGWHSTS